MVDHPLACFPPGSEEHTLIGRIDLRRLPVHVAITMDGNGRWAKQKNLERNAGHSAGAEAAREVTETAARLGIRYLTLFTFSSENWKRPAQEVRFLMDMLYENLLKRQSLLKENDIRLKVIGDNDRLPARLRRKLGEAEENSRAHRRMQVNLALNYGARREIVRAVRSIVAAGIDAGKIDEETVARHLYTADCPDPDLLIRTSGELRVSNFLLYQIAYSELYFTPTLWPDFRAREFLQAIVDYQGRERRFGKI
ncbi:MAG: isoprenyl transferase [Candidatus Aminicenantes bacterium]|nr:isoprenyl transferase [Candidatus Aminicenantes bacterium]